MCAAGVGKWYSFSVAGHEPGQSPGKLDYMILAVVSAASFAVRSSSSYRWRLVSTAPG
ncbi:hypothetical protein HPP92_028006 [Vanilla planifolia]|uniref:Uncharacterized protein n=1 Tax=Vanilla planifolia TaxID=51239 RepID=A0A835PAK0_VANPL|nr:hypothetical protein HPP92_028006 [Vanilla planifolia]KAG0448187.1 hypothetical protein HPP92_027969 [Vanilla planifolia]